MSAAALSAWYRDHARDLLARVGDGVVEELDASATKDGPDLSLSLWVAGVAGVGKSTLLNALLSDWLWLLPQGGVGSFTSTPIRIVHAREPYLAIRRDREAARALLAEIARAPAPAAAALQEARLLVRGNQFDDASPAYLAEVLLAAARGELSDRAARGDRGRLSLLAEIFRDERPGAWITWDAGSQLRELRYELEHNAAGFLSPLASEVELGWSAELLDGVQLVDLPGLGVAHDILRRRTKLGLAGARAVMLVVDRSGITEPVAEAVRPIFQRLTGEASDGVSRVVVTVTHLDQIACERRGQEASGDRRTWQAHFDELGAAAQTLVRAQLVQQLAAAGLGGEAHRARRIEIASRIPVVHVAPLEHRRYHRRDPEERSCLTEEAGGGVPRLRRVLATIGAEWIDAVGAKLLGVLGRALGPHSHQLAELRRALQLGINASTRTRR